jgi:SET domain-containing protein
MRSPFYEARQSRIHGYGLFVTRRIPSGMRILEYLGARVDKAESTRRGNQQLRLAKRRKGGSVYIFEVNDEWDIDGHYEWNLARLANHSCAPNCEARNEGDRIWIYALRTLLPGEEITFDYGYDVQYYRDHPCCCGKPNCCGYIVKTDQRPRLNRLLAAKLKRSA